MAEIGHNPPRHDMTSRAIRGALTSVSGRHAVPAHVSRPAAAVWRPPYRAGVQHGRHGPMVHGTGAAQWPTREGRAAAAGPLRPAPPSVRPHPVPEPSRAVARRPKPVLSAGPGLSPAAQTGPSSLRLSRTVTSCPGLSPKVLQLVPDCPYNRNQRNQKCAGLIRLSRMSPAHPHVIANPL